MSDRLVKIEELAVMISTSVQTINNWYRWKALHPESEFAELLPDYIQEGNRRTRYWKTSDAWKLIVFKTTIPHGRNGILGDITQTKGRKKCQKK